jgi:2-polyprenyl-3-methyl-5-hydroxy-6-metoxy-1,4-benzoquinol methylase
MIRIHHFAPGEDVADEAALEQFQKQWATYQKLVDNNSLASKQTGDLLHAALTGLIKPFAFVDIVCGDAGQMKQALAGTKINHYHGIDLSEPALELAAKNLKNAPFAVELDQIDFVEALVKRAEPADAAWCGPSIHHLSTEGKLRPSMRDEKGVATQRSSPAVFPACRPLLQAYPSGCGARGESA